MEIRQIIYFLALCEELHFTRAARRCGVAQPSLTNAIRALEREFGAPLFHRKPRPRLSELGAAVRPELERALTHVERALAHGPGASSRRRNARPMRTEHEREAFGGTRRRTLGSLRRPRRLLHAGLFAPSGR
jgi:DNA-binding transcriptional LysR family regulator